MFSSPTSKHTLFPSATVNNISKIFSGYIGRHWCINNEIMHSIINYCKFLTLFWVEELSWCLRPFILIPFVSHSYYELVVIVNISSMYWYYNASCCLIMCVGFLVLRYHIITLMMSAVSYPLFWKKSKSPWRGFKCPINVEMKNIGI